MHESSPPVKQRALVTDGDDKRREHPPPNLIESTHNARPVGFRLPYGAALRSRVSEGEQGRKDF